ncbi:hypothetical protein EXIGLDRAFT_658323, partial [Exidia glandulosa HHB12029]
MPPAPFYPPADASTYRDLFLFEERPKANAAKLKRTETRYQGPHPPLSSVLSSLIHRPVSAVSWPSKSSSSSYSRARSCLDFIQFMLVRPTGSFLRDFLPTFPYLEAVGLFVAVMTLVLFIATGTYTEKISYTNKYVPLSPSCPRVVWEGVADGALLGED